MRPGAAASKPHRPRILPRRAFTLIEMLVVLGVIGILLVLLTPAFTSLKQAGDVTNAAYTIQEVLRQVRSYAMANNTFTWVGFYEENISATSPTTAVPPYTGKGRVVLGSIYSVDGTSIFGDSDAGAPLPATAFRQIGKITKIEGIHLTDVGPPSSTVATGKFDGRPSLPYTDGAPYDHYNRISSDSADATKFPFSVQDYTFYKTVRFSPSGDARINGTYSLKHIAEIGLVQTHGDAAPTPPPSGSTYSGNPIAIQFSGIIGSFKLYSR